MAGIFPSFNDGGVLPNLTSNAYDPINDPVGTSALYFGRNCSNVISIELLNAIISEIACVVDKGGIDYDPTSRCNMWTSLEATFVDQLTEVQAGSGLTGGGPLTGNVVLALSDTGVVPGTYTVPTVTVDTKGRVTVITDGAIGAVSSVAQCYLWVRSNFIAVDRDNGTSIWVNGAPRTIPVGGVQITNTGYAASTSYYVYLYMVGPVLTAELSTTAPTADAVSGLPTKTGDPTRSFVGAVRTNGAGTVPNDGATIYENHSLSWYNRREKTLYRRYTANRTAAAGAGFVELNSEIRVSSLVWGGSPPATTRVTISGGQYVNGIGSAYILLRDDINTPAPDHIISESAVSAATTSSAYLEDEFKYTALINWRWWSLYAAMVGGTSYGIIGSGSGQATLKVNFLG